MMVTQERFDTLTILDKDFIKGFIDSDIVNKRENEPPVISDSKLNKCPHCESDILDKLDTVQRDLVNAEDKYKFLNNIINCLETRNDYKPIYDASKTTKNKDKYSVDHGSEITQYKAAVTEIKKHYPNGKVSSLASLRC